LILGSVEIPDVNKFGDHEHYHFNKKLKVLNEDDFDFVSQIVSPIINQALLGKPAI
jgi:hypothetical protein